MFFLTESANYSFISQTALIASNPSNPNTEGRRKIPKSNHEYVKVGERRTSEYKEEIPKFPSFSEGTYLRTVMSVICMHVQAPRCPDIVIFSSCNCIQ